MVWKISPLVYKLDLPFDAKIYPVISIVYLSRYRAYEDPFGRILPLLGLVEYGSDTDTETSGDDEKQGKHWELECIVVYKTRCGQIWYLVRWKGYGLQKDKWMKP